MDSVRIEKHAGLEPRGNVIYNDGELALIDDIHNLDFESSRQLDITVSWLTPGVSMAVSYR